MKFILAHATARQRAIEAVRTAAAGLVVRIEEPVRSLPQNSKMHAMVDDISRQCQFAGEDMTEDDWKRLMVDAFYRATINDPVFRELWSGCAPRTVMNLDGSGTVALGAQTRRFPKALMSAMVDWLGAWGAQMDVEWSDGNQA